MYAKPLFVAAGALGILAFAAPRTHAAPMEADPSSVTVRYGDLDLAGTAGAKVMLARINRAADAVCDSGQDERWDLARREQVRACVKDASAHAVAALASPLVTAMSQGENPAVLADLSAR